VINKCLVTKIFTENPNKCNCRWRDNIKLNFMERLPGDEDVIHLPYYLAHCYIYCRQNKCESKKNLSFVTCRERRTGLEVEVVVFERQGVEKLCVLVEWAGDTVMVGSEMQGVWGGGGRG
jgi:hypothetical protein